MGGSKDGMGKKMGMATDGTENLECDKMRDARCKHADGMEVEDELDKCHFYPVGVQMEMSRWALVSALK